ncbi:MAG: glycosyltransferase [Schaalia turicensis]
MRSLKEQCAQVVVADNASDSELLEPIREYVASEGLHLIVNEENLGIAAAQNQGIRFAQRYEAQFVLLSDDDSAHQRRPVYV